MYASLHIPSSRIIGQVVRCTCHRRHGISVPTLSTKWGKMGGGGVGGNGGEEEELPAIGAGPVPTVSQVRVPTPRVTTRIGMQEHRLD